MILQKSSWKLPFQDGFTKPSLFIAVNDSLAHEPSLSIHILSAFYHMCDIFFSFIFSFLVAYGRRWIPLSLSLSLFLSLSLSLSFSSLSVGWEEVFGLEEQQRRHLQGLHTKGVLWKPLSEVDSSSLLSSSDPLSCDSLMATKSPPMETAYSQCR